MADKLVRWRPRGEYQHDLPALVSEPAHFDAEGKPLVYRAWVEGVERQGTGVQWHVGTLRDFYEEERE